MTTPFRPLLLAFGLALLAGCSLGDAFIDREYTRTEVGKRPLPGYNGTLTLCYGSNSTRAERDRMAEEACAVWGMKAIWINEMRWQCRLTVPHTATYACINEEMRTEGGGYVNVFDDEQVDAWYRAKMQAEKAKNKAPPSPSPSGP